MKRFIFIIMAILLISGMAFGKETRREKRKAREKARSEEVMQMFSDRTLRFVAQSATPMSGGTIHLTSEYTLDIESEKVTAYLPFYGVAYRAEYGGGEGGIKFSEAAKVSDWQQNKNRKGYEVRLEARAPKDMYYLYLSFSDQGYGTLTVSSQNRQPISFYGIIEPKKEPEFPTP